MLFGYTNLANAFQIHKTPVDDRLFAFLSDILSDKAGNVAQNYCSQAKGAYHFFEEQNRGIINNHLGGKVKLVWEEKEKPSNVKVIETYSYTPAMY